MRAAFGDTAVVCGPCQRAARVALLRADGWVGAPTGYLQAFKDCGVDTETVHEKIWVAGWASAVVELLYSTEPKHELCGPILRRGVGDETFRDAVATILSPLLSAALDLDKTPRLPVDVKLRDRLIAFAIAQDVLA